MVGSAGELSKPPLDPIKAAGIVSRVIAGELATHIAKREQVSLTTVYKFARLNGLRLNATPVAERFNVRPIPPPGSVQSLQEHYRRVAAGLRWGITRFSDSSFADS